MTAESIELRRGFPQANFTQVRELLGRVGSAIVKERSWVELDEHSFLVNGRAHIPNFQQGFEEHSVLLASFDVLSRIFRMDMREIRKSSKNNNTFIGFTTKAFLYFANIYLREGSKVSRADDKEEVERLVKDNMIVVANDPFFEQLAGNDAARDLKKHLGLEPLETYIGFSNGK